MKKVLSVLTLLVSSLFMLVACQPKNDGNTGQEIGYARQAYDRCVQSRGQDACNVVRGNTVMSIREYYGNANNGMIGGAYPYNTGYNTGMYYGGNQYTQAQVTAYFDTYLTRASKEEIVQIANQWTNSWGAGNGYYAPPTMNTGRPCHAFGC